MTPEEKFMFDLEGYLVVKNVLTSAELAELNALADQVFTEARKKARVENFLNGDFSPEAAKIATQPVKEDSKKR